MGGRIRLGGQGGCEQRIEVIVKMQIKVGGSGPVGDGVGVEGWGWSRGRGWLVAMLRVGGDVSKFSKSNN